MSLVFTTTSCDMDLTPDSAVPEHEALRTIDDCDAWVVGIYSAFKNSALYSGYMTLLPDIQADMAYAALNTNNGFYTNPLAELSQCILDSSNGSIINVI